MTTPNPFLEGNLLIDYSRVTVDHLSEAIDQIIANHANGITWIVDKQQTLPTWDDLVLAVDELDASLQAVFYAVAPLAFRGGEWEAAVHEAYARVDERFKQKLHDGELFTLYERLASSALGQNLDRHQKITLEKALHSFRLAGVELSPSEKHRIAEIEQRIRGLEDKFSRNVIRSVERSSIYITDAQRLSGVAQHFLSEFAANAQSASLLGWLIPCEEASCRAVLEQASDRALREQVYRGFNTRGWSEDGEHDNGLVLDALAQAREEKARLLGYPSHLMFSLQSKSAGSVKLVRSFLDDLSAQLKAPMHAWQQAVKDSSPGEVQPWDLAYLRISSEAHDQSSRLDLFAEYFPLDRVMHALVELARQLFDLTLQRVDAVPAWDPSVLTFEVLQDHASIGYLYVDALQRPGKQSGTAFTSYIRTRRVDAEGLYHGGVTAVFSDVPPGRDGKPPLLDHMALRKLYHEFGHALHHLLVRTDNHLLSDLRRLGTDGVEVSGKLLERWTWDADYLAGISAHYQSGEQIAPQQMRHRLTALQGDGLQECAQHLSEALFDLDLHSSPNDGRTLDQRVEDSFSQASRWPLVGFERPLHALEHLVSGYDAGYYAYLWSDVHAFDLFTRFQSHGLLDARTGRELQAALFAPGGSRPLTQSIEAFLGRPASAKPYLQWHGLSGSVGD